MADYLDKYKGTQDRKSVLDILRLDANTQWGDIAKNYVPSIYTDDSKLSIDINHVVIGGNKFTNYGQFQFVLEKSYVKSPERSSSGVISNLNSYATFVTAHLVLNFSVMSIDDYRKIMKMDLEQNEFVVECYDTIYNRKFVGKMYFATPEMAKLLTIQKKRWNSREWEEFTLLYGVQDYTVELIGTNADLDRVDVIYHRNATQTDGIEGSQECYMGEDVIIGDGIALEAPSGYKFSKWNTQPDGSGLNYLNGYAYTINDTMHLYAQWESVDERILSFNYGLADPSINDESFTYENSRKVVYGKSIGILPVAQIPVVKLTVGNETREYTPYENPQWWKVPRKVQKYDPNSGENITDTLILRNNDIYWLDRDGTAYLLFDTKKYALTLQIWNGSAFETYQTSELEYGASLNLPLPVRTGYRFDGWYTGSSMSGTKASGNMTPFDLTLYGKWIEEK